MQGRLKNNNKQD